jgi:hypothetical protein
LSIRLGHWLSVREGNWTDKREQRLAIAAPRKMEYNRPDARGGCSIARGWWFHMQYVRGMARQKYKPTASWRLLDDSYRSPPPLPVSSSSVTTYAPPVVALFGRRFNWKFDWIPSHDTTDYICIVFGALLSCMVSVEFSKRNRGSGRK